TVPLANEPGGDSWKGDSAQHGGGVAWLVGSYDPKTDSVFFGTSNPSPWASAVRSTGDSNYGKLTNLYTSSTLAIDPDTGKIKWSYQGTPADAWDYDGVNEFGAVRPENRRRADPGGAEGGSQRVLLCPEPRYREADLGGEVRADQLGDEDRP